MTEQKAESVKVFLRICPHQTLNSRVHLTDLNTLELAWKPGKTFRFDKIFDVTATQLDIYQTVAAPTVDKALRGYNGTILTYGQSGTGKTFTIFGEIGNPERRGIIPNVFFHLFTQISLAPPSTSYVITITFLEIYNEEIKDLLCISSKKLEIKENPNLGVYVKNLTGMTVESMHQVLDVLLETSKARAQAATNLNFSSSRSHAIFGIRLQAHHEDGSTTLGKLNLVDLAGSERVSKSLATGDRLKEAAKINLSLSVLGNVISALVDGSSSYIPYRNSKLTRLLQDSLGGNCKTSMIATINPEDLDETYYTLMYAQRAGKIQNLVKKNMDQVNLLEGFEKKIANLRRQLQELEQQPCLKKKKKKKQLHMEAIEQQKKVLQDRITTLQKKVLIGGENLLEKAELQRELLEYSSSQLKILDSSHQLLRDTLGNKKLEQEVVSRKSLSLQEEDALLDVQIAETEKKLAKTEKLLFLKESEYQNEIGNLLHINKTLARDLALANYVINRCIDKTHLEGIKRNIVWDSDLQEYRLNYVAHCGNNLKKISLEVGPKRPVRFSVKQRFRKY